MATKLFVNLPVKDLGRSKAFFTELGLAFFGQAEDMASVIISEHTQVMLLTEADFASYAGNGVVDAARGHRGDPGPRPGNPRSGGRTG